MANGQDRDWRGSETANWRLIYLRCWCRIISHVNKSLLKQWAPRTRRCEGNTWTKSDRTSLLCIQIVNEAVGMSNTQMPRTRPCCHYYIWNKDAWTVRLDDTVFIRTMLRTADFLYRDYTDQLDSSPLYPVGLCEKCNVFRGTLLNASDLQSSSLKDGV